MGVAALARPTQESRQNYIATEMSRIEQFASAVINFSSQYGTLGTSSYTASNLASDLRVYPKYGDYTEAFVLVSCLTHRVHVAYFVL